MKYTFLFITMLSGSGCYSMQELSDLPQQSDLHDQDATRALTPQALEALGNVVTAATNLAAPMLADVIVDSTDLTKGQDLLDRLGIKKDDASGNFDVDMLLQTLSRIDAKKYIDIYNNVKTKSGNQSIDKLVLAQEILKQLADAHQVQQNNNQSLANERTALEQSAATRNKMLVVSAIAAVVQLLWAAGTTIWGSTAQAECQ